MSLAGTLGSRFALLVGGRVALLFLSLLATALLTRILGPDGFGHFRTSIAYLALVISLADLGLASLFVREISQPNADQARLIANALALRLALAGTAMVIGIAVAFVLPLEQQDRLGILGGAFGFLAYSVHLLLFGLFQQKLRQGGVVVAEISGGALLLLLIVIFAWAGAEPWWFAAGMGTSYAFTLAVTLIAANRLVDLGLRLEPDVWWSLIKSGAPLAMATVLSVIYLRADIIILAILHPPAEVGLYAVPVKVFDSFLGITLLFVGLFAPLLANTARTDEAGFRTHLGNGLQTLAIGTVAVAVALFAAAPEIVQVLAGSAFTGSVPILQLMAAVLVLRGLSLILRESATALNLQHKLMPAFAIAFVVAFAAYAALIPSLGGIGAVLSLVIAELVVLGYVATVVTRATGTAAALRVPLVAVACGLVAAVLAHWLGARGFGFFWRLGSAAALYLGLLLASRSVSIPMLWGLGRDMLGRRTA
jgi:O-antigen/teichoic acid export membrane protein